MSAQIPETMLLSDLLKPTGYDCPEDLRGKTFEEATTGGDAKISTNTAKTIDVSAYTEPVEVEPAEGYDATKKVTVTLDNIPSPGSGATAYAWQTTDSRTPATVSYVYAETGVAPADGTEAAATQILMGSLPEGMGHLDSLVAEDETYTRVSDTEFEISWDEGGTTTTVIYTRASAKDIVFWG